MPTTHLWTRVLSIANIYSYIRSICSGESFYSRLISDTRIHKHNNTECHFVHNWYFIIRLVSAPDGFSVFCAPPLPLPLPLWYTQIRIELCEWASIACEIFYVYSECWMLEEIKPLIVYDDWCEYDRQRQIIKCADGHDLIIYLRYLTSFYFHSTYNIVIFISFCSLCSIQCVPFGGMEKKTLFSRILDI